MGWLQRADEHNQRRVQELNAAAQRPAPPPTAFDRVYDAVLTIRIAALTLALFTGLVVLVVMGVVWVVRQV